VAVAERELELGRALRDHAVTDAEDLEPLLVPVRHAGDHVGHECPGQTVQRLALSFVVGPGDFQLATFSPRHLDRFLDDVLQGALRPRHRDRLAVDGHLDARRNRHGEPANA
jgi:hypothetical protein